MILRRLPLVVLLAALAVGVAACGRSPAEHRSDAPPVRGPARGTSPTAGVGARPPKPTSASAVAGMAFGEAQRTERLAEPPASGASFSFLVYGDTRSNPRMHRRAIALMASMGGVSFACHTGDLVDDGSSDEEWATFLSVTEPLRLRMPLYPVIGNHDPPRRKALAAFAKINGPPRDLTPEAMYYGVECGPVRIAMLDSETLVKGDEPQVRWLEGLFRDTRAPYRVVVLHRPLWSPGPSGSCVPIRNRILPLLRSAGVNVLFAGHDHLYYRTVRDQLTEIVTGGGAAPLYGVTDRSVMKRGDVVASTHHVCRVDVTPTALEIHAMGVDGQRIDEVRVSPAPGSGGR